jgi:tyrosyl-tRNA synthetase
VAEEGLMKEMSIGEQVTYLMQGTVYGDSALEAQMAKELEERLTAAARQGRRLRVYCGFDPTSTDLHIGHAVPLRKLRQFQELGHEVIFLVGTYTALIGDPSDKEEGRSIMTREEVLENGKTYAEQAHKVLPPEETQIRYNHEWLARLSFGEVIELSSCFTLQQILSRENFKLRWQNGEAVHLHETLYSLMQGYDACTLKADVQVGGTDQLFNIVTVSRRLMKARGMAPNVAIITGILPGTDGKTKMSKSLGNSIPILAQAEEMYGKVMSLPDSAIESYLVMATRFRPKDIEAMMRDIRNANRNPRDVKMQLAREIVTIFHSAEAAQQAEEEFVRVFTKSRLPRQMPEYRFSTGQTLLDVLVASSIVSTRSEGRRIAQQRGLSLDSEPVLDPHIQPARTGVLRAGKRRFLRLVEPL